MAFRNKLQQYKTGSGLGQTSSEELQSLTKSAERSIAPSSPMESSVIGASPDVAKMAGTPNQKTSALRVALDQTKNLSDVQRTAQARQQATGQESAQMTKANKAQNLSGLNSRVQALTNQMLTQAQASSIPTQLNVKPEAMAQVPAESQTEATEILNRLGTNQATNQDILRLNQLMGKTTTADMLTPEQLKQNFQADLGQNLAQATPDQINVSDLDVTTLGFQDNAELAAMLGIPEAELSELNLKELQEQSQKLFNDEFQKVNTLTAQAQDVNLGPAERAEARKTLKDMGATGVAAAESDIDKLADQVANADVVKFNNSEMPVEEMLSDEFVSGLVAQYINGDDSFKEQLKESEPELAKWIDDNKAILDTAVANLDEDVQNFAKIQNDNKLLAKTAAGDLSDNAMKAFFPDFGSLRDQAYDEATYPEALKILQDSNYPDKEAQVNLKNEIDRWSEEGASKRAKQLAAMSQADLSKLGVLAPVGTAERNRYNSLVRLSNDQKTIALMNPADPDSIARVLVGPSGKMSDLQQTLKDVKAREASGLFKAADKMTLNALDSNKDGILDSPEILAKNIKSYFPDRDMNDALRQINNGTAAVLKGPSERFAELSKYNDQVSPLYDKIAPALKNGYVDAKEINKLSKELAPSELQELYINAKNIDKDALTANYNKQQAPVMMEYLKGVTGRDLNKINDMLHQFDAGKITRDSYLKFDDNNIKGLEKMQSALSGKLKNISKSKNPLEYNLYKSQLDKVSKSLSQGKALEKEVKTFRDVDQYITGDIKAQMTKYRSLTPKQAVNMVANNYNDNLKALNDLLAQAKQNPHGIARQFDPTTGGGVWYNKSIGDLQYDIQKQQQKLKYLKMQQ